MVMNNPPQIYVSVDIGCHQHSVAIGLPNGDVWMSLPSSTARKVLNNSLNALSIIGNTMVMR